MKLLPFLLLMVITITLQAAETVRVGVFDHPPLVSVNAQQQVGGIFVEILQQAATLEDWQLEFVPGTWQTCLQRLETEEIDLLVSFTPTEARRARFDFNHEPVVSTWAQIYSAPGLNITSLADLNQRRVVGLRGDIHFQAFQEMATRLNTQPILLEADSDLQTFQMVSNGQADALVTEYFAALKRGSSFVLTRTPIYFFPHSINYGSKKDHKPHLLAALDRHLALQRANSASAYHTTIHEWLGVSYQTEIQQLKHQPTATIQLSAEEQAWLTRHPHIEVGTMNAWPPFDFVGADGRPQGIGVDVIQALNQRLGNVLVPKPGAWTNIYAQVQEKQLPALMDITPKPSREADFNFTQLYLTVPHVIIARRNGVYLRNEEDLHGKTLALEQGFGNVEYFRTYYPTINVREYANTAKALDAVARGEADAYAGNRAVATYVMAQEVMVNLEVQGRLQKEGSKLAIGVRKDWLLLRDILQKALDDMSEEEKHAMLAKWTMTNQSPHPRIMLTEAEHTWLKQHPVIRVAADPDWAPLEYIDKQGRLQGISADYLQRLTRLLNVRFEPSRTTWQQAVADLKAGKLDMFASVRRTAEREHYATFTESYLSVPIVLFTNPAVAYIGNPEELAGHKVAVVEGYAIQELLARDYPDIKLLVVPDIKTGLQHLAKSDVTAFAGNLLTTGYYIRDLGLTQLKVAGRTPYSNEQAMAARKDLPHLASILRKALTAISEPERNQIYQRWVAIKYEEPSDYSLVWKVLAVVLPILALFIYWNRRLLLTEAALRESENQLRQLNAQLQSNISVLETTRDASEAANRAKSLFLANMSHELRTPLNAILGFSQLLAREPDITPPQRDKLKTINRAGEHLLAMINDVLDLSKIEAGKVELKPENFDLVQMFQDLAEMFHFRAKSKGLTFHLEMDSQPFFHVKADQGKLRQILINLLGNAVKFTHQGEIHLRVTYVETATQTRLQVEVEDTGTGISTAELEQIFEPFSQASTLPHGEHQGTGLGLAISRSFIELMGGCYNIKSTLGEGTCFRFEVPIETMAQPTPSKPISGEVIGLVAEQREWRILVVDDDEDNRKLLSNLLTHVGFDVREAQNGLQAVNLFQTWQPHFIWLDMRMPVMDGYDATRRIRALPGGDGVAIVAVTASVFIDQQEDVLAAGCDQVVRKPYQSREIFETLAHYLAVRYEYASTDGTASKPVPSALTATDLACLPPTLLQALLDAVLLLNTQKITEVVAQIQTHDAALAEAIQALTTQYHYEELMELCEQALNFEQENRHEQ